MMAVSEEESSRTGLHLHKPRCNDYVGYDKEEATTASNTALKYIWLSGACSYAYPYFEWTPISEPVSNRLRVEVRGKLTPGAGGHAVKCGACPYSTCVNAKGIVWMSRLVIYSSVVEVYVLNIINQ